MINQSINSANKNVFAPLQGNSAHYAISKPFTEEQKNEFKTRKDKHFRDLGFKVATGALLTGVIAFGLLNGLPKGMQSKLNGFFSSIKNKTAKMKEMKYLTHLQKAQLFVFEKINFFSGVVSVKDVFLQKIWDKTSFTKKLSEDITNLFEKISLKKYDNAYEKSLVRFDKMHADYAHLNNKLNLNDAKRANGIIEGLKTNYDSAFSAYARSNRYNTTQEDLRGLHHEVWNSTAGNAKSYLTDKKSYQGSIAEEKAAPTKIKLSKEVASYRDKIVPNIEELLTIYKKHLSEKEYLQIEKSSKKLIKSLDVAIDTETDKLFDKIRDLKLGSAPADVASVLTSIAAVIYGLAQAENSDERASVALKTGIPIMGGMLISLYCTVALISSGPSLFIGAVSGLAISKFGEILDKIRKDKGSNTLNIAKMALPEDLLPTLNEKTKLI